jgi:hypothetical protein
VASLWRRHAAEVGHANLPIEQLQRRLRRRGGSPVRAAAVSRHYNDIDGGSEINTTGESSGSRRRAQQFGCCVISLARPSNRPGRA